MEPILIVLGYALDLYKWVIIVGAVMSWLVAFNVVNIRNDAVRSIWNTLTALTEPVLRPIRRYLPNMGGVDISPVIAIFIIILIQLYIDKFTRQQPF